MLAEDLVDLLAAKHGTDLFVPQCKTGPTPCPTLDAWAMARSWAHPATYGYEVKVTRGDWLRDRKWEGYLGLTTHFGLVAPRGVIQPEEVPAGVGLYLVSKGGGRLITARKAVRQDRPLDLGIVQYVLQSRVRVVGPRFDGQAGRAERIADWGRWVEETERAQAIGYRVKAKIGKVLVEQEKRLQELQRRTEAVELVAVVLKELGIDLHAYDLRRHVLEKLQRYGGAPPAPPALERVVRNAIASLSHALGDP